MATGNDLVGYLGSKELGLGSNANVPAIDPNANLNPIIDAGKNIMLLDAERNMNLFKQKIADRDKRLELFDKGQIASGNILEQDKPDYDNAKKKANDAFYKMVDAGGINNQKAYAGYQDAVGDLQNTVTHAQERYTQMGLLKQDQAKETIPSKIQDYQKHIDEQNKKGFNTFIDPYQHLLDFKNDEVTTHILKDAMIGGAITPTATTDKTTTTTKGGKTSTTQTETTGQAKGKQPQAVSNIVYKDGLPYNRTIQRLSLGKMNENAISGYFEPETGAQMDMLLKKMSSQLPPYQQKDALTYLIQRAEDYNKDNGFTEGVDQDAAPVSKYKKALGYDNGSGTVMPNPVTGKYDIGLSAPEFSALWTLGNHTGSYVSNTDTYMKDEAAQSEKTLHDRAMEGIGREKADAYANLTKFKLSTAKTAAQQNQALDDMFVRNLTEQKSLIEGLGNDKYGLIDIQADKSLPVYTIEGTKPTLLKPIGAKDIHSTQPTGKNKDGSPIYGNPKDKIVGYKGGHYQQEYLFNGRPLATPQIETMYRNYETGMKKKGKEAGGRDNFIRGLIANNVFNVKLTGENGSTDKQLSTAAQRIINNLDTKKGQTGVFDENDNPPNEDAESQSESGTSSSNNSNTVAE